MAAVEVTAAAFASIAFTTTTVAAITSDVTAMATTAAG